MHEQGVNISRALLLVVFEAPQVLKVSIVADILTGAVRHAYVVSGSLQLLAC